MPPLLTPHELTLKIPEPHSTISVRNLSTTLPLARDAWGRPSKSQPVLISCSLSLRYPFSSAAATDTVTSSTIHYGTLSKAILECCEEFRELCEDEVMSVPMHLRALVCYLQFFITGCDTLPRISSHSNIGPTAKTRKERKAERREPVVKCKMLQSLSIEILLPKASLLGSGVGLEGSFVYEEDHHGPSAYSMVLKINGLRIPTLIGVNDNERRARQVVVASVEVERWGRMVDAYNELEEIVVKTIEESSFQTLEGLASHLSQRIIKYFLIPHYPPDLLSNENQSRHQGYSHQRVRIRLEKPTAVMFADSPAVEVLVDSDPKVNGDVEGLWKDYEVVRQPPFPLESRLDEWISSNEREGRTTPHFG